MKRRIIPEEDFTIESGGLFSTTRGLFSIVIERNSRSKIPYFIITDNETRGANFYCKLSIKEAKYHGKNNDKLSQQDVMSLVKHLDYSGYENNCSKWNMIIDSWNFLNDNKIEKFKRPEYENLMFIKGAK